MRKRLRALSLGSAQRDSHPDSVRSYKSDWLAMPSNTQLSSSKFTVATYAGKDKQVYVDMVVMLGLAIQEQLPEVQRVCIVVDGMSSEYKKLLKGAGWTLFEVKEWSPPDGSKGYWSEVYNKIDFFRLPFDRVLTLDADTAILKGDSVRELLRTVHLPSGHIGMVKDCCSDSFNSGVMLLHPDTSVYDQIVKLMNSRSGPDALDQPTINEVYGNGKNITSLPAVFNVHGYSDLCDEAVIAHFTGSTKPTAAKVSFLEKMSAGDIRAITGFICPSLYVKFFHKLKQKSSYLTHSLQLALDKVDNSRLGIDPPRRCFTPPALLQADQQAASKNSPRNSDVFDHIYKERIWGGDGVSSSLSGGGSYGEATKAPCHTLQWLVHMLAAKQTELSDMGLGGQDEAIQLDTDGSSIGSSMPQHQFLSRGSSSSLPHLNPMSYEAGEGGLYEVGEGGLSLHAMSSPISPLRPAWSLPRNSSEIHLVDAAAGDFFWMPQCLAEIAVSLPKGTVVKYVGVDVAATAVELAEKKRAKTQAKLDALAPGKVTLMPFQQRDLTAPKALDNICGDAPCDMIFCNDALMHNPHAGIHRILRNFNQVGAQFLVTNSYRNGSSHDIKAGQWRALDLDKSPYGPEAGMVPMCGVQGVPDGGKSEWMYTFRMPVQ